MQGVLVLVAVRMKSTRLTGKALKDLAGAPLIERLFERLAGAATPEDIVLCTSTNPNDDPLAELAEKNGWAFHRGHELNVMQRFLDVAHARGAHTVVRVTGDNPLTDPVMLDYMVERHVEDGAEYSYTEDLPRGTRSEVISAVALETCNALAADPDSSEYMTLMLRRPDRFRVLKIQAPDQRLRRPELRLTVDTPEDYAVVRAVYESHDGQPPDLPGVISWLDDNPEVKSLNEAIIPREIDASINVALQGDEA